MHRRRLLQFGTMAVMACASPAIAAQEVQEPVVAPTPAPIADYGALPSLETIALSPSGQRIAFVTVEDERRLVALMDLSSGARLGDANIGSVKLRDIDWIGEDQILATTSSTETLPTIGLFRSELYIGQLFTPATRQLVTIMARDRNLLPVMVTTPRITRGENPSVYLRGISLNEPDGLDLYRIDTTTGRARMAERMSRDVEDYVLSPSGEVAARSTYDTRTGVWTLQLRQQGGFRENWRTTELLDIPSLIGLGMTGDSVIVAAERPDLRRPDQADPVYFDVNQNTGAWRALRFEFDPDGLLFHPVSRRMIGAFRDREEGRHYVFFDADAAALWSAVRGAFPQTAPRLVSWSNDLRRAVVFTSGSNDSGSYHLVDMTAGTIADMGLAYPSITPDRVAPITAISYAAADGLTIQGYLTTPPGREARDLPLVVLAHGGPASHDVMGFDWWAQALASRGYAVLQPNFRGSTGYGKAFEEAGYGEWGRKMQTDLSDGVRHLAAEGVIDPRRVCIAGASYGGYAALAGPTLDRGVYRCAISVAGVSDLRRMVELEASDGPRRDNPTTRYWNRFMGAERLGDRSLDARSPARLAAEADAPILLIHGRDDSVVPIEQSRTMAAALRRAGKTMEFIELDGEDHWLSRSDTRQRMLAETLRFLQTHNPGE